MLDDMLTSLAASPWALPLLFAVVIGDAFLVIVPGEASVTAFGALGVSTGQPPVFAVVPTRVDSRNRVTREVAEALELLRSGDALVKARETVAGYADRARAELAVLPPCPAIEALRTLTDYTVERVG